MADEVEGLVVAAAFAAVEFQGGGGSVATYPSDVPLTVVHGDRAKPNVFLFGPQGVEVVPMNMSLRQATMI